MRGRAMNGWADDFRSALRSLRRSPGFAAFAVGTLALGIGATITFAAFLDRIVLRPVDFPDSDRLVMAWRTQDAGFEISPDLETRDRVRSADVFDAVAATGGREVAWSTDDGPRMLDARTIDSAFPVLAGLPPLLGRFFTHDEMAGSGAHVLLLSEGLWKRAFGADPNVLGRSLRIDGDSYTVVGVASETMRAPGPGDPAADIWLPLPADGSDAGPNVYARLKEGVTLDQASERMDALDLAAAESAESQWRTRLMPVRDMVGSRLKSPLKAAGAAVALLLLISCINLANLLLARGDARLRDTAVRAAVGAGRLRLAREMLLEHIVIGAIASAIGLGLAALALSATRALRPDELRLLDSLRLDPWVTAAAIACGAVTVVLFGALPLLHRTRTQPGAVLGERASTGEAGAVTLRRALLVGEVALSFALLACGVQIVTTLGQVRSRDPGLAVDRLLSVRIRLPEWRFPDPAGREAALAEIRERVLHLPGVERVAVAANTPPRLGIFFGHAEADGQVPVGDDKTPAVLFGNSVGPGYFDGIGQELVRGRDFTAEDTGVEPAPYILSESAAARYFPDGDAVGGRFRLGEGDWHPIVGVVHDIWATGSANDPAYPQLYVPLDEGKGSMLLLRTDDPARLAARIRTVVANVDREIPVLDAQPMATLYRDALARERLIAMLLGVFAVTAATLAAAGLYGVVAHLAVRRTREFGIRISLGAEPGSIFELALRDGLVSVVAGLVVGCGLAWAGLRLLHAELAGLEGARPLAFLAAAALLGAVTLAAMSVPAVRAARIDPAEALRAE